MKLIKPSVEYIPQSEGLDGMYKHIELCSRICYKSEDRITEDSAKKMIDGLIKAGHGAMLEHGTAYLQKEVDHGNIDYINFEDNYTNNPYSKIVLEGGIAYVTANMRVLVENNLLSNLEYACKPTEYHKKRYTLKFVTDMGVCRELLRHRKFSFANESTRYCNYSKSKFGGELTFITPTWYTGGNGINDKECSMDSEFELSCEEAEKSYLRMISWGAAPQEARQVLPLATKTELVMTGFEGDWRHFFGLRLDESTGKVHPDMKKIANMALIELEKNGFSRNLERH